MADSIDLILAQWRETRPDIDPSPMELPGRLIRAANTAHHKLQHNFADVGLEQGWFDVLATLYRAPDTDTLSAGELTQWVMVTGGAVTNRVTKLAQAGLVHRNVDPENRRRVLVTISDDGKAIVERILEAHLRTCRAVVSKLSDDEVTQLNTLLKKLAT